MNRHIIIIGAGVAGLSAGIYLKRSGFDVTIMEQHTIPGGMCTSWQRKGYLFEGGIHWMTGSSKESGFYKLWKEVGALNDGVNVRYDEPFRSVEWEGKKISLYRDLQKLKQQFDEISPEDAAATKRLVSQVKVLKKMEMPITDIKGVKTANPSKISIVSMLKMLPSLFVMGKAGKLSVTEYADQFKHPGIRLLINSMIPEEYSAISVLVTMATLASGDGGYPQGGSLAMAKRMADTFTDLGGRIHYQTKVDRVVVRSGSAAGVSVNGDLIPADAVIVTQEILAAADQLFDMQLKDEWLAKLKRDTKPAACSFVCLGVKAVIKEIPSYLPAQPIRFGDFTYPILSFNNYWDYSGYAPKGCTALTAFFGGDSYDFWKKAKEEGRYESEKQALAEQVIEALYGKYPQAEGNIEVVDVATPLTYERYTGASRGSWMSVLGKGEAAMSVCPCTLEEVKGVYFAGHRTMAPGGLPVALSSGRSAAQMVCRQFDVVFR